MIQRELVQHKVRACILHFLLTLAVALLGALLIFGIWYPDGLADYVGGVELYQLVLIVELALGPLMSLVIYNPTKHRSELVRDYTIVGLVQLAALVYGLYVVAQSRPAYEVFVKDRIEIVSVLELAEEDIEAATDTGFTAMPWLGPHRICVEHPENIQERNALLFSAVAGKDIQLFPKYYRECQTGEQEEKLYPAEQLKQLLKQKAPELLAELPDSSFAWLPVKHRFGVMVEVYPNQQIDQGYYLPIDPF